MSEIDELTKALRDSDGIAYEGDDEFEYIESYSRGEGRWTKRMTTIVRGPSAQLYAFDWEEGLTENQENYFPSPHPRKVRPRQRQITITEYVDE